MKGEPQLRDAGYEKMKTPINFWRNGGRGERRGSPRTQTVLNPAIEGSKRYNEPDVVGGKNSNKTRRGKAGVLALCASMIDGGVKVWLHLGQKGKLEKP